MGFGEIGMLLAGGWVLFARLSGWRTRRSAGQAIDGGGYLRGPHALYAAAILEHS